MNDLLQGMNDLFQGINDLLPKSSQPRKKDTTPYMEYRPTALPRVSSTQSTGRTVGLELSAEQQSASQN